MLHDDISKNKLPKHVAIIMDGNGRWAKARGLERIDGHEEGAKTAENIIRHVYDLGIRYLTLYAFSNENWQRDKNEVEAIFKLLDRFLKNDIDEIAKKEIKINAIGDMNRLPPFLLSTLKKAINKTRSCNKLTITFALSYSALWDVQEAVKGILNSIKNKELSPNDISPDVIKSFLSTTNMPDPDLMIRTSGEMRLSNFLLLQLSYAELYFTKTLWPDFQKSDFENALKSFVLRQRRFGR